MFSSQLDSARLSLNYLINNSLRFNLELKREQTYIVKQGNLKMNILDCDDKFYSFNRCYITVGIPSFSLGIYT